MWGIHSNLTGSIMPINMAVYFNSKASVFLGIHYKKHHLEPKELGYE